MLLITYNRYYAGIHYVFGTFVSTSRPKSIYDLFFIFSLVFVVINHITPLKQTHLFFVHFSECLLLFLDDNVDEKSEYFSNSKCSASGCCLAFTKVFANFNLALLIKVLLIKRSLYFIEYCCF